MPSAAGDRSEDSVASKVPVVSIDTGTSKISAVVVDTSIALVSAGEESAGVADCVLPQADARQTASETVRMIEPRSICMPFIQWISLLEDRDDRRVRFFSFRSDGSSPFRMRSVAISNRSSSDVFTTLIPKSRLTMPK